MVIFFLFILLHMSSIKTSSKNRSESVTSFGSIDIQGEETNNNVDNSNLFKHIDGVVCGGNLKGAHFFPDDSFKNSSIMIDGNNFDVLRVEEDGNKVRRVLFSSVIIGDFEKTVFPATCTKSQLNNVLNGVSSFLQKNGVKKEETCRVTVRSSQKMPHRIRVISKGPEFVTMYPLFDENSITNNNSCSKILLANSIFIRKKMTQGERKRKEKEERKEREEREERKAQLNKKDNN